MKRTVHIIGGGFSGLVTARALIERGFQVHVYERSDRVGGLIRSPVHPLGIYETAANGILNTFGLDMLFQDAGVEMKTPPAQGRRRFILRSRQFRRWPLGVSETLGLLLKFFWSRLFGQHRPRPQETLRQWSERVLTRATYQHLVAPAMQGIYAGEADRLSASLILNRLFSQKRQKLNPRGTVFPADGMEKLILGLMAFLKRKGVQFHFGQDGESVMNTQDPVVIATSAPEAAALLRLRAPDLSHQISRIEMLPLLTVQLFATKPVVNGFGVLFPRNNGLKSLGVIGDHSLFPNRSTMASERWILGGALDSQLIHSSDQEIKELVLQDRRELQGVGEIRDMVVTRWPQALPHYTLELEEILDHLKIPPGLFLIGNYLGSIGLTQIFQRSAQLANQMESYFDPRKS